MSNCKTDYDYEKDLPMRVRMIDPPNGHLYGFPKPFNAQEGETLEGWLLANGYPQEEIDVYPRGVPCRVYFVERPEQPSG